MIIICGACFSYSSLQVLNGPCLKRPYYVNTFYAQMCLLGRLASSFLTAFIREAELQDKEVRSEISVFVLLAVICLFSCYEMKAFCPQTIKAYWFDNIVLKLI